MGRGDGHRESISPLLTRFRSEKNVAVLGRESTAPKDRRFSRVRRGIYSPGGLGAAMTVQGSNIIIRWGMVMVEAQGGDVREGNGGMGSVVG